MRYDNNDFKAYVNFVYKQYRFRETRFFWLRLLKVLPVLAWRTVKDAGIELLLLVLFWVILVKMSQGRDLIVSLFEPGGLYGLPRIGFTTLAVLSFSFSMWIIPAFLFHQRELRTKDDHAPQLPFTEHLFFMHRVLPLVPFWLLASILFNGSTLVFVLLSIAVMCLLYYFNTLAPPVTILKWTLVVVGVLLLMTSVYFFAYYQEKYTPIKIILALNLYLISIVVFQVYLYVDTRILDEHATGVATDGKLVSLMAKYHINTGFYLGYAVAHTIAVLFIYYRPFNIGLAPESLLLYMFSVYVFAIDLVFYLVNVNRRRQVVAAIAGIVLVILLFSPVWNINVSHYTMDANDDSTNFTGRLRDNFADRYAALKGAINANTSGEPYPIILVSGEGGGSRAGLWLSQNLINFDYETQGKFRNHIFSMSTVSGSSVGLSTLLTFWDKTRDATAIDTCWLNFPSAVYANNYVGSSIRGLLLTDLYKSLVPGNWKNDRNTTLQNEEAVATERAVLQVMGHSDCFTRNIDDKEMTLKKDLMYFFYEPRDNQLQYRSNTPIVLINTTRSNDGRRGIISSIRLSENYFNEAIDIAGYIYEDSICNDEGLLRCKGIRKPISLGQACNTSELFPVFSAPAYIENLGSFVDGGYHENSGLKTTLDIYQQLKMRLDQDGMTGKYRIYILYLKNGSGEKQLYKKIASQPTLLQPLSALFNQPFEGSASYFEEKAKCVSTSDSSVAFIAVNLKPRYLVNPELEGVKQNKQLESEILSDLINDVVKRPDGTRDTLLNFPLARWLSKTVINRIQMCAAPANRNVEASRLLQQVKKVNGIGEVTHRPFSRWPEHQELKVNAGP